MEWDPPSADGVKVLDIVPTYVGTHRLTGDVHTGGMRAQPLSYTLTSISTYVPIVIVLERLIIGGGWTCSRQPWAGRETAMQGRRSAAGRPRYGSII